MNNEIMMMGMDFLNEMVYSIDEYSGISLYDEQEKKTISKCKRTFKKGIYVNVSRSI